MTKPCLCVGYQPHTPFPIALGSMLPTLPSITPVTTGKEVPSHSISSSSHMPRSLASLHGPPSTPLSSSSHLELQPEKDSVESESQEHSLHHELVTTKEICQQLLESINSLSNVSGGMNVNDPFLILLHQVHQDYTVPHYSANELPNVKYFWKANFLCDHHNGHGYLKTKFGYAPPTWAKVSSPALKFFAHSMWIKFSAFCYCADNWKDNMFMSMYYPGWTGHSHDSEGIALDIKEERSTPMLPNETILQKQPQSISLPLTPQFTKKKKEVQLETPLSGSSGSSSHVDLTVADQNSPANVVQDDNLIDDAYKCIKPELMTQPVGLQALVLCQLLGGLNSANLTEINVIATDPMLAPATPVSHPNPMPAHATPVSHPRPLCKEEAQCDRQKLDNACKSDFHNTLELMCNQLVQGTQGQDCCGGKEYKRKATMVKEMKKNAMQSMLSSTVSVHISNGRRSSNPEALNIPSAIFNV
ncbi:hypothetical protein F5J12DRAFT_780591 [Pisolithus orientalis]|uniref:uncharacterized protein n=1 Tax=Pisolithus orientalis TaxID=936130 RepID=UPI002224300B|nr:uncharacterized protein F5J12DRAFT_780591 [Pisolithus orientalis]KAI6025790.1 hypothetical protein F5J12DRAFT_780591 [Pisolithus orientalis]